MQQYSIGAVSKLTNIPAHTLRKWESRHGIATPLRSETGRRVYTDEHVEHLKLIKRLIAAGHALGHLADLDDAALRDLVQQLREPQRPDVTSLTLVGPNVARLLPNQRIVSQRYEGALTEWLTERSPNLAAEPVVVECETLPAPVAEQLLALRSQVARLLVVYTFAPSHALNRLKEADIDIVHGPINDDELLLYIAPRVADAAPVTMQQRFSAQELARIAALRPALQCECPKHIAKLLMDIASFEKYSIECSIEEPEAQSLHNQLADISAQARVLFENALIEVASADGIQLQVNS